MKIAERLDGDIDKKKILLYHRKYLQWKHVVYDIGKRNASW